MLENFDIGSLNIYNNCVVSRRNKERPSIMFHGVTMVVGGSAVHLQVGENYV